MAFDPERGCFRWQFHAPSEAFWRSVDSLSWIANHRTILEAYEYLDAGRGGETVFGAVFDLSAPTREFPDAAAAAAADRGVADAEVALADGRRPDNLLRAESWTRCRTAAVGALQRNPNDLRAPLMLVDLAQALGDWGAAHGEWLELYFRLMTAVAELQRIGIPIARALRILDAYAAFDRLEQLEALRGVLGLTDLLDPGRWATALPLLRGWSEMRRQVGSGDLVHYTRVNLIPGIQGVGLTGPSVRDMQTLADVAARIPRTDVLHAELVRAVPLLAGLLRSHGGRFRDAALATLVAIADPLCASVLEEAQRLGGDSLWLTVLGDGLNSIRRISAVRGVAWRI